jgi:hypothetical protein
VAGGPVRVHRTGGELERGVRPVVQALRDRDVEQVENDKLGVARGQRVGPQRRAVHRGEQHDVGHVGQRRAGEAGQRDRGGAVAARLGEDLHGFPGLAGVRDTHGHVAGVQGGRAGEAVVDVRPRPRGDADAVQADAQFGADQRAAAGTVDVHPPGGADHLGGLLDRAQVQQRRGVVHGAGIGRHQLGQHLVDRIAGPDLARRVDAICADPQVPGGSPAGRARGPPGLRGDAQTHLGVTPVAERAAEAGDRRR